MKIIIFGVISAGSRGASGGSLQLLLGTVFEFHKIFISASLFIKAE